MPSVAALACCACVLACRTPPPPPAPPAPRAAPLPAPDAPPATDAALPDATGAVSIAPTPSQPACEGPDRRAYGSTCCDLNREPDMIPGMVYLSCYGPQIGKACHARRDCDVVCSCDPPDAHLGGGTPPAGPPDGTRGAVGHCGGRMQIGTLMCEIDEHGIVGHIIVD